MPWTPRWVRRRRARTQQRLAALAEEIQEHERRAARQRLLDAARRRNAGPRWDAGNAGPAWNAPTRALPYTSGPLLTPGQAHRTRQAHGGRFLGDR